MKLTKKQLAIKESVIAKLKEEQANGDLEGAHINGDDLLCLLLIELGCKDVVNEWREIDKWYA
jgi:hypothetical protein